MSEEPENQERGKRKERNEFVGHQKSFLIVRCS
jgi:hypothetical protein